MPGDEGHLPRTDAKTELAQRRVVVGVMLADGIKVDHGGPRLPENRGSVTNLSVMPGVEPLAVPEARNSFRDATPRDGNADSARRGSGMRARLAAATSACRFAVARRFALAGFHGDCRIVIAILVFVH